MAYLTNNTSFQRSKQNMPPLGSHLSAAGKDCHLSVFQGVPSQVQCFVSECCDSHLFAVQPCSESLKPSETAAHRNSFFLKWNAHVLFQVCVLFGKTAVTQEHRCRQHIGAAHVQCWPCVFSWRPNGRRAKHLPSRLLQAKLSVQCSGGPWLTSSWTVCVPSELSACGLTVKYWQSRLTLV